MSITSLEANQTSSQLIKIMAHVTPGQIIVITPTQGHHLQKKQGKNPFGGNGIQLRCNVCDSIYHMAQNCPD